MGKSAPSAPAAPSPAAVGQANQQTALWNASLSNANQNSPLGSQTFQLSGDTNPADNAAPPQYTETTTLNPQEQQLLDQTTGNMNSLASTAGGLMSNINTAANTPIDYNKLNSEIPSASDIQGQANNSFNAQMSQLQPLFDQQNEQTNSNLLNQGITPGSAAWNNQMRTVNDSQNNAEQQAIQGAAQYGQTMDQTQLANMGAQNSLALQQQSQPINEYSALMGQTQVQSPQFSSIPSASNPGSSVPAGGNALEQNYAQQMQAYNSQVSSQNQMMGGLFGLGGSLGSAGIMASML